MFYIRRDTRDTYFRYLPILPLRHFWTRLFINDPRKKMTGSPGQTRPLMPISIMSSWWTKICQLIFFRWGWSIEGSTCWYMEVLGGIAWYLVVLSQYKTVLVGTWLYLVIRGRSVLGGAGPEQGGTGCQCDMLSENIWFTWSKPSNYWISEEEISDDLQINRQREFPLVDSTPSVEGVK